MASRGSGESIPVWSREAFYRSPEPCPRIQNLHRLRPKGGATFADLVASSLSENVVPSIHVEHVTGDSGG